MKQPSTHVLRTATLALLGSGLLLKAGLQPATAQLIPPISPPQIWAPTTVPFASVCTSTTAQCEEVGRWSLDHLDAEVVVVVQPNVDDPVAQWGDCLASVFTCLDGGQTVSWCTQNSACPSFCKTTFASRLPPDADEEAAKQVFEGVFLADGADCLPTATAESGEVAP